jgi:hypothetical protein
LVGRGRHEGDDVGWLDGVGWGEVVASGAGAAYAEQHPNAGVSCRSLSSAIPVLALALRNGSVAELGSPPIQCAADSELCSHAVEEPSAHTHPVLRVAQALPALRAPIQNHGMPQLGSSPGGAPQRAAPSTKAASDAEVTTAREPPWPGHSAAQLSFWRPHVAASGKNT